MLLGQAKFLQLKEQAEILVEESLATSAIEGEQLDRDGVRSSVARKLGLPTAGLPEPKRNVDGVVECSQMQRDSIKENLMIKDYLDGMQLFFQLDILV